MGGGWIRILCSTLPHECCLQAGLCAVLFLRDGSLCPLLLFSVLPVGSYFSKSVANSEYIWSQKLPVILIFLFEHLETDFAKFCKASLSVCVCVCTRMYRNNH